MNIAFAYWIFNTDPLWSLNSWNERADRDLCIYLLGVQYWLHHKHQFWWTSIDWLEVSDKKLVESERKLGTWASDPRWVTPVPWICNAVSNSTLLHYREENQSFYYDYWSKESFPGGASGKES